MVPIRFSTRGDVLSTGGAVGEGDGVGEGEGEGKGDGEGGGKGDGEGEDEGDGEGDGEGEGEGDGEGDGEGEGEGDGEGDGEGEGEEGELLGTIGIALEGSRSIKEEDGSREDTATVGTGVLVMVASDVIGGATGKVESPVKLVVGRAVITEDETTGDEKALVFMTTGDEEAVIFMTTVVVKAMVTQV